MTVGRTESSVATKGASPVPQKPAAVSKRIPSLDGVRGIALGTIILVHTAQRLGWPRPGSLANRILVGRGGGFWQGDGVTAFFVLSGFLITTLLLREFEKRGSINLTSFYVRRAFRILPPLFVYLAAALAFCVIEHIPFGIQNFTSAAFFYRDYYWGPDLWITQHTWTLSVEEQFYFLWPLGLAWVLRNRGRMAAAKLTTGLVLLTPVLRMAGKLLNISAFAHHEAFMFHSRMDSLMAGCCVALFAGTPQFERFYQKFAKYWWVLPIEFYLVSLLMGSFVGVTYRHSIGMTVDAVAMALFILWATRNPDHWVGRILNWKPIVAVGVVSYSAYLWQTFYLHGENPTFVKQMPLCYLLIAVTAWISYVGVEETSRKAKDAFERWFATRKAPLSKQETIAA